MLSRLARDLKRLALTGGALCLSTLSALAGTEFTAPVTSVRFGVICNHLPDGDEVTAPDTNAGKIRTGGNLPDFDIMTDQVPAMIGFAFGIEVETDPEAGAFAVEMRTQHPSFGEGYLETESWPSTMMPGGPKVRLFTFEFDYELAPGRWTFEIVKDGAVILRQDFDVLPELAARPILQQCPGYGVIS
ncbi:DUF3859 domain-containing protein [Pseudooceanicola sp. C21-150M6]|uniref:DUF3859 domain-containing protein n=1 Tax=Pseudooceanicola sp. C21-150M6 TaxID=3434355 RepID=UPI003D7F8ED0